MHSAGQVAVPAPASSRPRCPDRDRPSIEVLYARYLDTVFGYVLDRVRQRAEAEDITAETFEAAARWLPRFRGECRPDAWLLAIARQKMALAARRSRRTRRLEALEADLSAEERETLSLLLTADIRQLPEDKALRDEAGQVMRQLLARLPERQREALLLQVCHGLSVRETAHVLGSTEAAANSLRERARATLFRRGKEYFQR